MIRRPGDQRFHDPSDHPGQRTSWSEV